MGQALFTDLYELTMLQAYFDEGLSGEAVFDLFVRRLPPQRQFLVACGLEPALEYLEGFRFAEEDLAYLESLGRFTPPFLRWLEGFRFTGDLWAMPEGTIAFAEEPLIEVVAPLPQAQVVETFLLNQITFGTLIASKAARAVLVSRGKRLIDFGSRRAHGTDAGLKAARALYLAGYDATSNVEAGRLYGIPVSGTMAHSYVQAHESELDAFRAFVRTYPDTVLLVDTYDTEEGVRTAVKLAREMGDGTFRGIRLDSGDLAGLAKASRAILDEAGLHHVQVFVSGGLDERRIDSILSSGAPVEAFGVGTAAVVSSDAPALDTAYKLVEYEGRPRIKLSTEKSTLPGKKQVFRRFEGGRMREDVLALAEERLEGEPLLRQVMRGGRRTEAGRETLEQARERARTQIAALPDALRSLDAGGRPYEVRRSEALQAELDSLRAAFA
ncbi:MAG TPA: nicotinate phosphoribosyltransferase [Dehalococcoidia bacterium]|nr:nicotinate phosphoribosyltransferase [Dehalococcoidia bacterium]